LTPKSDDTGKSGTLPAPELNPLLNPILNKNLGRWAEVYFTNPPEKREEAVVHLLRQLESGDGAAEGAPRHQLRATEEQTSAIPARRHALTCRACGFQNELQQKFCGDCGAQLSAAVMGATAILSEPIEAKRETSAKPPRRLPGEEGLDAVPQFGSILHLNEPALERVLTDVAAEDRSSPDSSETMFGELPESGPLKRSYRAYIALVVAAIIGGLGYTAWRGGQSKAEESLTEVPPAATQPASAPAPVPESPATEASSSPPSASTNSEAKPSAPAASSDEKAENPRKAAQTEPLPLPKVPASPNGSPAVSGNGSQELATALSLLNAEGERRDSAQAAQWLWKAVEKKNTAATILLAGLYLRGDGVQKNCDQGHILLDAAADKGNKDAANLLRNLQAFGCQ
jgi:hypothetical protein